MASWVRFPVPPRHALPRRRLRGELGSAWALATGSRLGAAHRYETLPGMIELGSQRHLFEVPADVAYFNTANMSPLLRGVREAGEAGLARRARPWLVTSADWFEDVERLRQAYAAILGGDADGVALVPATSYGIAIAARNLSATPGDTVVVLAHEFPSNYYTWSRFCGQTGAELVVVERERGATWTEAVLSQISDRTRVLAVPNVHWTDGALLDLDIVVPAARRAGASVVIDASQSLGAKPLDVSRLRPDYVVSVGYKWLLGPLGVGCLYVDARHREGEPLEENWINRLGSDDFASLVDYIEDYQPGARRFDVGERTSFGLVPMAIAAADQLLDWTIAEVAAGLQVATDQIAQQAEALGLSTSAPTGRGPHMLGIELPRDAASAIAGALSDAGVVASVRGNALRIAPHLHTTRDDLDRLANVLAAAVR
jgi:selenocysteine lyase/cysteine desulfurase